MKYDVARDLTSRDRSANGDRLQRFCTVFKLPHTVTLSRFCLIPDQQAEPRTAGIPDVACCCGIVVVTALAVHGLETRECPHMMKHRADGPHKVPCWKIVWRATYYSAEDGKQIMFVN